MNQDGEKGSPEPKPRYVWDPKKLAWVETTEPETAEPATEKAAVEPKREEALEEAVVETKAEEVTGEVEAEGASVEGVAVEAAGPRYKGAGIRFVALVVDLLVFLVISIIMGQMPGFSGIINSVSGASTTHTVGWQQGLYFAILSVYFVGFWTWRGQTPGKMVVGAKIVKTDGSPIGIRRAILRFAVFFLYLLLWGFIGVNLGYLFAIIIGALVISALNRRKKGIHDYIAGTVVINSRAPKPQPVEAESADEAEATEETAEPPGANEPETDKQE